MKRELSKSGLELIKSFESLRLTAYKAVPTEIYYSIGYGHYGPDVYSGMEITVEDANRLLMSDVRTAVNAVNALPYVLTQKQFDALVSFTYNCGSGNLKQLTQNGKRTIKEIECKIPAYNKSSGKVLRGLVNRRAAEQKMFRGD